MYESSWYIKEFTDSLGIRKEISNELTTGEVGMHNAEIREYECTGS